MKKTKISQDKLIRELAKGLVALCIRNNNILEDYHAEGVPINDERMKEFMKNCVNNVYTLFLDFVNPEPKKLSRAMDLLLYEAATTAKEWDEPEIGFHGCLQECMDFVEKYVEFGRIEE